MEKTCKKCLITKPTTEFYNNTWNKKPASRCKECVLKLGRIWWSKNREARNAQKASYRAKYPEKIKQFNYNWRRRQRDTVLEHYGKFCACCGEDTYEFLSLDHINGGGTVERKAVINKAGSFYHWVIKQNFPDHYQILCHNCNLAKGFYGKCPHKN